MKQISSESAIRFWDECIETILFPEALRTLLSPELTLATLAGDIFEKRKEYKGRVDALIGVIRASSDDDSIRRILLESDPITVAFYWDRLQRSRFYLVEYSKEERALRLQKADDLISFLLFHERVQ